MCSYYACLKYQFPLEPRVMVYTGSTRRRYPSNGLETTLLSYFVTQVRAHLLTSDRFFVKEPLHQIVLVASSCDHLDHQSSHPRLCDCKQAADGLMHIKARLDVIYIRLALHNTHHRKQPFFMVKLEPVCA